MKTLYTFLLTLIISISIYSQNFKEVKIYFNNISDIQILQNAGMEFDHFQTNKDNSINVFIVENDFAILQSSGFSYEIVIDNWNSYYSALPKMSDEEKSLVLQKVEQDYGVTGFNYGSMGGFYTLAEVNAELDEMYTQYPNLITQKVSIGNTIEGRPMYMVKISDNPNQNENEPQVLYTGLHHAREPESMEQMIFFMFYLLENYGTDPEVTYLVNNRELYFIPVVNPDGYEYNHITYPSGGGMWRKNRRNNGGGTYGVDLNRNYGPYAYWNAPNGGSSTYPGDDTYRGTAPFSEPETNSIKNFLSTRKFKNALNYHTYGNDLIFPYGALNHETPDSLIFREYAIDITAYNGYTYGTDLQTVGYSTRGNSDDYSYDGDIVLNSGKIFAMTPEVGTTGFWPSQSEIIPLAQENILPNLYYAWVGGEYVSMINPNYSQQYFNPGDNVLMNPIFKNKGLSTGYNISLELTSLNAYSTVTSGTASFDSIQARGTSSLSSPLSFTVSPIAPSEAIIKLLLTTRSNGNVMKRDTLSLIVGVPTFVFSDTTNNPSTLWTITGTPVSAPKWAVTTATYNSPPNSYTDSPAGNYVANSTITMTLTNPINLIGYANPRLTFYTKFDIENDWDYGQVEISTNNGSTWIPLQGQYTNPGTGSFQPNGEPLYDGTRTNWVREEISLSSYISSQVKLKFVLKSDGSVQKDGWYVDDIGIIYYSVNPVQQVSFNALVEGFYNGTSMVPDTVTVELRNTSAPYSLVDQSKIFLDSNGQGSGIFHNAVNGTPYYIVLKHRNSVETWSALPQIFNANALNYDFTTGSDKAYGYNLKQIGSKWVIYGGDVNQDGFVETADLNLVFNDNVSGITGYVSTDLNGDMFTEIEDLNIVFTNNVLGVERKAPLGYLSKKENINSEQSNMQK